MSLSLLPLLAVAASPPPLPGTWATFTREGALSHQAITVEAATDGVDPGSKRLEYKLRRTERSLDSVEVKWANSRRCPAIRPVLAGMRDLAPPRLSPPGIGDGPTEVILDGVFYSLSAPAGYGGAEARVTVSSNVGTPLAAWVDKSLAALDRCWSAVELRVGR